MKTWILLVLGITAGIVVITHSEWKQNVNDKEVPVFSKEGITVRKRSELEKPKPDGVRLAKEAAAKVLATDTNIPIDEAVDENLSIEDLKEEIGRIDEVIERHQLIERANQQELTSDEVSELKGLLRKRNRYIAHVSDRLLNETVTNESVR